MANTGMRTGLPQQDICRVELVMRKLTGKASTRNIMTALASVTTETRRRTVRNPIALQLQRLNATTVTERGIAQTIVPIQSWTNHQRLAKLIGLPWEKAVRQLKLCGVNATALQSAET